MTTTKLSSNATIALLRSIGSPFGASDFGRVKESQNLYDVAQRNKIGLLYLESLERTGRLKELKAEYEAELVRCQNQEKAMAKADRLLREAGVKHTFFKTLRPYPSWGKDADVMVLGDGQMYEIAIRTLLEAGYEPELPHLIRDISLSGDSDHHVAVKRLSTPTYGTKHVSATGTDFIDPVTGVDLDLQREFGTSYIVWMDKDLWREKVIRMPLASGDKVATLAPELEMVVVIIHGLVEQSYRLGDYYTFLYHLASLSEEELNLFLVEVRRHRLVRATRTFLALAAALHQAANGFVPERLLLLSANLGISPGEPARLVRKGFHTPHRYGWWTLLGAMAEKLSERKFTVSLLRQWLHMFNPGLTRQVFFELRERSRDF
ncbi:MAG: nucleotidyltransferase family protein [Chloroflexi bacterium]|nr:nucleotidyltransferase family protein [Chloroflexota bacterium]